MKSIRIFTACTLLASIGTVAHAQSSWMPYGPDGGDARSFASDPSDHNHIYLGTVSGTIFDTHDGGQTWKRLASVGRRDDLVLDNILVDPANPKHVLIGGWVLDRPEGGLYVTNDGGQTWAENTQMKGHSIRALSIAPSDSKTMILGALDGVYRSTDSGNTWARITPAGSTELHEIESVAIDPKNPEIIYAVRGIFPGRPSMAARTGPTSPMSRASSTIRTSSPSSSTPRMRRTSISPHAPVSTAARTRQDTSPR